MAKTNVPSNNENDKTSQSSSKRRKQTNYQQALSYERAFQKKKEELSKSSAVKQLKAEIDALQKRASADLVLAENVIRDKETLEVELSRIRAQLASDLANRQLALIAEQRKNEYAAHQFASACAMKAFQTQNVHQRAQTTAALADAQKIQTEKIRNIKSAEIADLQAQKKSATTAEEKRKISAEIRKLQKDITAAENQEATFQQEAAKYADIVKKVDFERLSATEKLTKKEQEIADLKSKSSDAVAAIDSSIEAKKIDLAAATESGNTKEAESIRAEIDDLENKKTETVATYDASINEVQESIDKKGGYKDAAQAERGTKVSNRTMTVEPTSEEDADSANPIPDSIEPGMDTESQLAMILSCLTAFVSSFENYVGTLDSKLVTPDQAQIPDGSTDNSAIQKSQGVIGYLQNLVDGAAGTDIEMQTQLQDKISRLSDVIADNPDIDTSTLIQPLSGIDSMPVFEGFLTNLEAMLSEDAEEDEDSDKSGDKKKDAKADAWELLKDEKEQKETARYSKRVENEADKLKLQMFLKKENKDYRKEVITEKAFEQMQGALDKLVDVCKEIDEHINNYYQYQASVDARLQGTDMTYQKMLKTLSSNLGMSMIVSQEKYVEQFRKIVEAGISHNTETRAFLATVSDKVINTFDVFDSNLLKLIRIQQNDSTAARMGLESSLNKLFNSYFSDSSYLNDAHDAISSGILEASSMLSNEMSLEFEYAVHKWLGALYSLGVDNGTLESIAKGLNYLGTGNVQALNNDESLQTLLAMSANKGGESYADILVNGLNADTTNNLLRGMIEYLMEIATNTDNNQVTRSAYSDLFGLQMSDLRAIINLTAGDIESLSSLTTTYSKSVNETQNQLASIITRTHASQLANTLFDNAVIGASLDIGNDPVAYGLWKTLNLIEGVTGGIALPFINVFGSGFDLNTTVTALAKSTMAGFSMMSNLLSSLGAGGINSGMDINDWNNVEMTSRGSADKFLAKGTTSGFSTSTRLDYAGSGNTSDIKKTELSDAADSADSDKDIINKNQQDSEDVPLQTRDNTAGIWASLAEDGDTVFKQSLIANEHLTAIEDALEGLGGLPTLLDRRRVFLSEVTSGGAYSNLTIDSTTGLMKDYSTQQNMLNKIKSSFSEILSNTSYITDTNVDIWDVVDRAVTSNTSLERVLETMYTNNTSKTSGTGFYNFEGDSTNLTANSKLVKQVTNKASTTLNLMDDLKKYAEIQQLNKIVFPEYVRATIDDLAPNVKKYSEELLKRAIEMSLYGSDDISQYDEGLETIHPLIPQLKTMLTSTVLQVENRSF